MKKLFNIIKNIFVWVVCAFTVVVMIFTVFSVSTFDRNDRAIFGLKFFIVLSDSMSATDFDAGDVVLIKEVDPATLRVGDIVCFTSTDTDSFGETVTHKIREVTVNEDGDTCFITYGTTTGVDDAKPVTFPYVKGKYVAAIPKIGTIFTFLKTVPGYICCILIPFLILIAFQGFNSIKLFKQYKKEQNAAIEAERAQLEAERAESQKMMDELLALKAQLSAMKGESSSEE